MLNELRKIARGMLSLHGYTAHPRDSAGPPIRSGASNGDKRYLVTTLDMPASGSAATGDHRAYLDRLRRQGRIVLSGPFVDCAGGAYLLKARDLVEATALAHDDPRHANGASKVTVHEWDAR